MTSALYVGHVAHARFTPKRHKLRYPLFMLLADLDELEALNFRTLRYNRTALLSFYDKDHGARVAAPLRPQIERKLADAGIAFDGGRIALLSMPRVLGYVFNPLSVYFCWRRSGELAAIIYEVRNTFGERHDYVLPARVSETGDVAQRCEKDFFVSPFMEMDLGYAFQIRPPGEDVRIGMVIRRGEEVVLTASFAGERRPLTEANLLRAFAGNPLMTFTAIAGIHWEAVKLLLKGVPYLGRRGGARREKSGQPA